MHEPSLPGLFIDTPALPQTEQDWFRLDVAATDLFSPHAPVDAEELFSGRQDLLRRMTDVVFQRGLHAILFGERGVGKTSLTQILKDKVFKGVPDCQFVRRQCTAEHDYDMIWRHVFDEFTIDGKSAHTEVPDGATAYDVVKLFESFPNHWRPVIIIDEFDRVKDPDTARKMADTIKYLADTSSPATVIIVGVATNVAELFGSHASIHRNIQQIPMPAMSNPELTKIIDDRAMLLRMTVTDYVRSAIVEYSQGFPGYTHLLGQSAFRGAIARKSMDVTTNDLGFAMQKCVAEAEESVRDAYANAVRSSQSTNLYRQALLACALAATNEKGCFKAAAVKRPFEWIEGRPMDVVNYAQHLKEFCKDGRGPVLERVGRQNNYEFRFANALLRPYTIIRGRSEGLLPDQQMPAT